MSVPTTGPPKLQCLLHGLFAIAALGLVPVLANELLRETLFSSSYVWVRRGTVNNAVLAALDEFLLAPPYVASYQPGWIVGLIPGAAAVLVTWGLWNQRPWARPLTMYSHVLVALVAGGTVLWSIGFLLTESGGGNPFAGVGFAVVGIIGAIAAGALLLSSGLLWKIRKDTSRDPDSNDVSKQNAKRAIAFAVAAVTACLIVELTCNRLSVYQGDAAFQGRSTGEWLALLASHDEETRRQAVQTLRGSHDSVPVLREIFRQSSSGIPGVRNADSIDRVYWSRAHVALGSELRQENILGEPFLTALADLNQDDDPNVRRGALQLRVRYFPEASDTIVALIDALLDQDRHVRKLATYTINRMEPEARQAVLPQLKELIQNPALNRDALRAIIGHVDPEAAEQIELQDRISRIPELLTRLRSDQPYGRRRATYELGAIGEHAAEATEALIDALKDNDVTVRYGAAGALGNIGPSARQAVPHLVDALKSRDHKLRTGASIALGKIGPDARVALGDLQQALNDDQAHVRMSAAEALWEIDRQTERVIPLLLESLKSSESHISNRAAEILVTIDAGDNVRSVKSPLAACLILRASTEKPDAAQETYDKVVASLSTIPPDERTAADWGYLGQALYRSDDWAASRTALEAGISLRNEETPTLSGGPRWWYLTMALTRLGETDRAEAIYKQLVEQMRDSSIADSAGQKRLRTEAAGLLFP